MLNQLSLFPSILLLAPLFVLIRLALFIIRPSVWCRTTLWHELGLLGFCFYLCALCHITIHFAQILRGQFAMGLNYNLAPLAGIKAITSSEDPVYVLLNIVGNVVLFFPFGFLLPLLWRGWVAGRICFVSLLLSGGIEVLQLFTGRAADIDDVILNTFGGMTGFLAYQILRWIHPKAAAGFRLRQNRGRPSAPPKARPIPQADRPPAKNRRGSLRTAFLTTIVTLCVVVTSTVLFTGFSDTAVVDTPIQVSASSWQPSGGNPQGLPSIPAVNSANLLLVSGDMSQVLYEEKAQQRIYPASLTKIMTAILALESIEDMDAFVPLGDEMFAGIYKANLSTAGFQPGEMARALDLVYGVILPSGAECSIALAEYIGGSEKAFVEQMNEKARELGMDGTHFVNATGAHHPKHTTTAKDMALLLSHALKNPTFRAVATTAQYQTAPTSLHPQGISFASTLLGKTAQTAFSGGMLLGGKTGYTDEAGQCLASFAEIDGREYILITAGAKPADFRTEQLHIEDAFTVYAALGEAWYNKNDK